jgi:hypothetical protein
LTRRRLWFRASDQDFCEWDRGAVADKGRRQALLQAVYKVETIADPTPWAEPEGVWADLLAAMEADEEFSDLAQYWRQLIAGTIVPEWRQAQAALGLTQSGTRSIGLAPEDVTEMAEAATAAQIKVSAEDASETLVITPEPSRFSRSVVGKLTR